MIAVFIMINYLMSVHEQNILKNLNCLSIFFYKCSCSTYQFKFEINLQKLPYNLINVSKYFPSIQGNLISVFHACQQNGIFFERLINFYS